MSLLNRLTIKARLQIVMALFLGSFLYTLYEVNAIVSESARNQELMSLTDEMALDKEKMLSSLSGNSCCRTTRTTKKPMTKPVNI